MIRLIIATRNSHKTREIQSILGERFRVLTLIDFPDAPKPVEDAETFGGNATKKAVELARWVAVGRPSALAPGPSPLYVLADDSGLEVDALGGAPGVHSARFAALNGRAAGCGENPIANTSDADNNAKLLHLLRAVPLEKRTGRFRCALALAPVLKEAQTGSSWVCYADEIGFQTELFEGVCEGRIGLAPRGQNGFGYDPLFIPDGCEQSFAELSGESKNRLSHRGRALARLRERLFLKDGGQGPR